MANTTNRTITRKGSSPTAHSSNPVTVQKSKNKAPPKASKTKAPKDTVKKTPAVKPSRPAPTQTAIRPGTDHNLYEVIKSNWYKALPYGFRFVSRSGESKYIFLPISPQNLSIVTHMATNVHTTLYATVEEHSEQRYFDIVIEGTTGIAPEYPAYKSKLTGSPNNPIATPLNDGNQSSPEAILPVSSRYAYPDKTFIDAGLLGGFGGKTIGVINSIEKNVNQLLNGGKNEQIGVADHVSGYLAFHTLYQFLLKYKQDTASGGAYTKNLHPLYFLNYKDNNEYKCAVQRFVLKRDISNPMLYKYQIVMRAYDLRTIGQDDKINSDRILGIRRELLGLNGVKSASLMADIKSKAQNVKNVIGGVLGGFDILGR